LTRQAFYPRPTSSFLFRVAGGATSGSPRHKKNDLLCSRSPSSYGLSVDTDGPVSKALFHQLKEVVGNGKDVRPLAQIKL
jgi:hypothetical protein